MDIVPSFMLPIALAGASLVVILLVCHAMGWLDGQQQQLDRRILRAKSAQHQEKTRELGADSLRRSHRDSTIISLDRLIKRVFPNIGILRERLERSGWPIRTGDYMLITLGSIFVATTTAILAVGVPVLVSLLIGITIGVGAPHILLQRQINRRTKLFTALLPEALDLVVRGVRSGLPVTEALKTIAEEIDDPVGCEFRSITDQMQIGIAMDEAMWQSARRLRIPEFNFLIISMTIQQETGGNLAEILDNLSDMVRRREQMRLKIKAMSSEARASSLIIGSLPFIMCGIISFVNPKYIQTLFSDPRGWVMIAMGLASLLTGIGVMVKMVRFEI